MAISPKREISALSLPIPVGAPSFAIFVFCEGWDTTNLNKPGALSPDFPGIFLSGAAWGPRGSAA